MLKIGVRVEPRDAWVGVYWEKGIGWLNVYVCLLPFLPILVRWRRAMKSAEYVDQYGNTWRISDDEILSKGFMEVITDDDGDAA